MDFDSLANAMIAFLKNKVIRSKSVEIGLDTPLVTSGLVDSFALNDVLLELERITACRLPSRSVTPKDLNTVREMLNTAERLSNKAKQAAS